MTATVQPTADAAHTNHVATNVTPFPAIKPGFRLVPATIGRPGQTQVIWVECPNWCQQDHLADREVAIEDIDHYAAIDGWSIDSILSPGEEVHSLYVRVHSDPSHEIPALRAAHVLLGNGAPFDSYLTADDAEEAADQLALFVAQIRAAARTVRLHNQHEVTQAVTA